MMYLGKDPVGLATSLPQFADIAKIECGRYIPSEDIDQEHIINIPHSLGTIPDFLVFFIDSIDDTVAYSKNYILLGHVTRQNITVKNGRIHIVILQKDVISNNQTASGATTLENIWSDTQFKFIITTNAYLKANAVYNYVIGKFKEVTANANE